MAQRHSFEVSEQDVMLIDSILTKVEEARQNNEAISCITLEDVHKLLIAREVAVVERVFDINPLTYGFKGRYVGVEPMPEDAVRIGPQPYFYKGERKSTRVHYLPKATYGAFKSMADAMQAELHRPLLIDSSYRSGAFQAVTFLKYLKQYDYNVPRTASRVAVPGYSEHGTPSKLALDLQNIDGQPDDENPADFEHTREYQWLVKNAGDFHFTLSYPRRNSLGVMFEPWHWRHIG